MSAMLLNEDVEAPQPKRSDGSAEMRVLILSHMDPRLSRGGAEFAAFQHYQELQRRPGVKVFFLSAAPGRIKLREGIAFGQPFGEDNFLYSSGDGLGSRFDHFNFGNADPDYPAELAALLDELRPDIVHAHHYTNFGVETFDIVRRTLPDARIVLTLHEYLAICNHFGQMVKRPSFALCDGASPQACHVCYPEHSPQDFFMRELFVKRFFRSVDAFVSPSRFLADRYIAWGIDPARISVIENGVPDLDRRGLVPMPSTDGGLRIGFFGQISRLKGVDVALEAARILEAEGVTGIQIEVYGDPSAQPLEFQERFRQQLQLTPSTFTYAGPYENARVDQLMQSVHAVLVPSIWWENSPVVIEEALANHRPVIASDIGGMAEKVRDSIDGFQFQAGSARALAALLKRLAADPSLLSGVQTLMRRPASVAATTDALLHLYAPAPRG